MKDWLLDFYDETETFYLFLVWALLTAWLILFLMFAIPNSKLVKEYTAPVAYRDESIVLAELTLDWEQLFIGYGLR